MLADKEGRIVIPHTLREIARIEFNTRIAVMYENPCTVYLAHENQIGEGKFLDFRMVDNKGRVALGKLLGRKGNYDYTIYLKRGILFIEKSD